MPNSSRNDPYAHFSHWKCVANLSETMIYSVTMTRMLCVNDKWKKKKEKYMKMMWNSVLINLIEIMWCFGSNLFVENYVKWASEERGKSQSSRNAMEWKWFLKPSVHTIAYNGRSSVSLCICASVESENATSIRIQSISHQLCVFESRRWRWQSYGSETCNGCNAFEETESDERRRTFTNYFILKSFKVLAVWRSVSVRCHFRFTLLPLQTQEGVSLKQFTLWQ